LQKYNGVDAQLLDLRNFLMPFFDQLAPPVMRGRPAYENDAIRSWLEPRHGLATAILTKRNSSR
jgi:hypothetical protein